MIPPDPYRSPAAPLVATGPVPDRAEASDLRWLPMVFCGLVVAAGTLASIFSIVMLAESMMVPGGWTFPSSWDQILAIIPRVLLVAVGVTALVGWATGRWRRAIAASVSFLPICVWIVLTISIG